ncbi:MAG: hypothetical protein AMXMBFR13_29640 [Phycisphaerae bacterium]
MNDPIHEGFIEGAGGSHRRGGHGGHHRHEIQHSDRLNPAGEPIEDPAELADAKLGEHEARERDRVEEASDASFPASDPPGFAGTPPRQP